MDQGAIFVKCNRIEDMTSFYVGITNTTDGVVLTDYNPICAQNEQAGTDFTICQALFPGDYKLYIGLCTGELPTAT